MRRDIGPACGGRGRPRAGRGSPRNSSSSQSTSLRATLLYRFSGRLASCGGLARQAAPPRDGGISPIAHNSQEAWWRLQGTKEGRDSFGVLVIVLVRLRRGAWGGGGSDWLDSK